MKARIDKFVYLEGKSQLTINPEWLLMNYPTTYTVIEKEAREGYIEKEKIKKLIEEHCTAEDMCKLWRELKRLIGNEPKTKGD